MIAEKEKLAARLSEAFDSMGISEQRGRPQRVADEFDVSRETARKWLAGEAIPETLRISEISRRSGLAFQYLMTGEGPKRIQEAPPSHGTNFEPGPDIFPPLPLISYVQAGMWNNVVDPYLPGVAEKWVPVSKRYSRRAYCLRVRGDSMESPMGISFPDSSIITIEPEMPPEHKRFVITRLDDTEEATFKQLIIEGASRYLKPLNPRYPILEINRSATHCGCVRQLILDFD